MRQNVKMKGEKMKKLVLVLVLVVILIASFALQGTTAIIEWGGLWQTLSGDERLILIGGTISGNIMNMIIFGTKSVKIDNAEITKLLLNFLVEYADYLEFYNDKNFEKMIGVIDRFYSNPDNKFCNPASLAYLGYLESKGEDITKLLRELQVYSEAGS